MAMIYQASAGVTNAKKLTISMWCRAHTTNAASVNGEWYSLLEFGNPNGVFDRAGDGASIFVQLNTNSTTENIISFQIAGVLDSVAGADAITSSSVPLETGSLNYAEWASNPFSTGGSDPYLSAASKNFTPYCLFNSSNIGTLVDPEKWFHLMIAIDASLVSTSPAPFSSNNVIATFNGTVLALKGEWATDGGRSATTNGTFIPSMASRSDSTVFTRGPWQWTGSSGGLSNGKIPAFNFDLTGTEIGIPSQRTSPFKNAQLLDMADVQIWVGTYIDPTNATNFSKLVSVVDGRGSPVNPDIAADYFGLQTYLFKGQRDDFLVNNGTGGAFSYNGTITTSAGVSY